MDKHFAQQLTAARRNARDPIRGGSLTQERFAELVAERANSSGLPTAATVSNWENGRARPRQRDRVVVVSIVTILLECKGLPSFSDANKLLGLGGYAPLTEREQAEIHLPGSIAPPAEGLGIPLPAPSVAPITPGGNQNITGGTTGVAVAGDVNGGVAVHMPASLPPTAPHQLRAPTTDFVGRTKEITDLVAALGKISATGGMAAISGVRGMNGIGKSELAYEVAAQLHEIFPYQIELDLRGSQVDAAISSIQALQTVINAFGSVEKLPDDERELTALYCSLLSGKRVLIFADDARDAAQVRPLMPPPGSALLITSRLRFRLPGMVEIDLDRLAETEAIELLQKICSRLTKAQAKKLPSSVEIFHLR